MSSNSLLLVIGRVRHREIMVQITLCGVMVLNLSYKIVGGYRVWRYTIFLWITYKLHDLVVHSVNWAKQRDQTSKFACLLSEFRIVLVFNFPFNSFHEIFSLSFGWTFLELFNIVSKVIWSLYFVIYAEGSQSIDIINYEGSWTLYAVFQSFISYTNLCLLLRCKCIKYRYVNRLELDLGSWMMCFLLCSKIDTRPFFLLYIS